MYLCMNTHVPEKTRVSWSLSANNSYLKIFCFYSVSRHLGQRSQKQEQLHCSHFDLQVSHVTRFSRSTASNLQKNKTDNRSINSSLFDPENERFEAPVSAHVLLVDFAAFFARSHLRAEMIELLVALFKRLKAARVRFFVLVIMLQRQFFNKIVNFL